MTELCYVVDINGNQLSPTNYNKGWNNEVSFENKM